VIDTNRLFPYKTFNQIPLTVEALDVDVDGKTRDALASPPVTAQPGIDLSVDETFADWTQLRLRVNAVVHDAVVRGLLPSDADVDADIVMVVSIRCRTTKLRRRAILTRRPRGGGWDGELSLHRGSVRDVVELSATLARKSDLLVDAVDDDGVPFATHRGAVIGFGKPVSIRVDAQKERGGSFKVRWENFKESDDPWRREREKEMFHIDVSDENPEVVLNSAHELLRQTLMKKRPSGADKSIKNALLAYVAHSTWTSLFLAAIDGCVPDEDADEEIAMPADELRSKVLKRLLPLVVPERGEDEHRLRMAVELYRDGGRIGTLLTRLNSAIQALIKIDNFVVRTLETSVEESE
jgi:hypothetical protein